MDIKTRLAQYRENGIRLEIAGRAPYRQGGTRFGGKPDLPPGFEWPVLKQFGQNENTGPIPLNFVAQFDCEELARYDTDHLLPDYGVLSFFFTMGVEYWGYDPEDKDSIRVFWFEDKSVLRETACPYDTETIFREDYGGCCDRFEFPRLKIRLESTPTFPDRDTYYDLCKAEGREFDGDAFDEYREAHPDDWDIQSQLVGWSAQLQGYVESDCERVARGYRSYNDCPPEILKQIEKTAVNRWRLLFQLDCVNFKEGDERFELMFGDCGLWYFMIPREDLRARRFDRVWVVPQCC